MSSLKKEGTGSKDVTTLKKVVPKAEGLAMKTLKSTNEELIASAIRDLIKRDNLD